MEFITQKARLIETTDGLTIERSQAIPDSFMDDLANLRFESKNRREGEFMKVCSVPVSTWEQWERKGYDPGNMTAKQIVARLKLEGLDGFLATDKEV